MDIQYISDCSIVKVTFGKLNLEVEKNTHTNPRGAIKINKSKF